MNNPSAFPQSIRGIRAGDYENVEKWLQALRRASGMTLRDYFAAKLLPVLFEDFSAERTAKEAYKYADAMLKARNEE